MGYFTLLYVFWNPKAYLYQGCCFVQLVTHNLNIVSIVNFLLNNYKLKQVDRKVKEGL